MQLLTTTFPDKQKTSEKKFNEKQQNQDSNSKNGKQNYNRAKMSNKRCIKARLQYLQRGYKAQ